MSGLLIGPTSTTELIGFLQALQVSQLWITLPFHFKAIHKITPFPPQIIPRLTSTVMNELENVLDNRPSRPPMISTLALGLNQRWQSLPTVEMIESSLSMIGAGVAINNKEIMSPSPSQGQGQCRGRTSLELHQLRKSLSTGSIEVARTPTQELQHHDHQHDRVVSSWNSRVPTCKMQWAVAVDDIK